MAFIPDDAEDRFSELSPSAERFYIFLCRKRNHKLGVSFGTVDECAAKYGWKRSTKFAVVKELVSKGWIVSEGAAWRLTIGDFSPVNKSKNLDSKTQKEQSKFLDSPENQSIFLDSQSKNLDSESKKSDYQSKNLDSHIRNIPALPALPEINTHSAGASFGFPLKEFFDAFPETENLITPAQVGILQSEIGETDTDRQAWQSTIKIYQANYNRRLNSYLPEKIGNVISVFKKERQTLEKEIIRNGSNQNQKTNGNGQHHRTSETTDEVLRRIGARPARSIV